MTITILIPAFNEEKTIGEVIARAKRVCKAEIIVIDDASTDDTAKIAKESGAIVVRNQSQMGPSVAVRRGIKEAHGTLIVTIDADLDHLPEDIPKLLVLAEKGSDIVIGKRANLPRMSERVLSFFTNTMISIKDPLSGFRVYNSRIFSKVDFGKIETYGMVLLAKSFIRGFQISEVPINTHAKKRESRIGYSYRVDFRIFISGFLFITCLLFCLIYLNPVNQFINHD